MTNLKGIIAVGGMVLSAAGSTGCKAENTSQPDYQCQQIPLPGERELTDRQAVDQYCLEKRNGILNCLVSSGFPKQLSVGFGQVACQDPDFAKKMDYLYSSENHVSHSCVTGGEPLSKSCEEIKVKITSLP